MEFQGGSEATGEMEEVGRRDAEVSLSPSRTEL